DRRVVDEDDVGSGTLLRREQRLVRQRGGVICRPFDGDTGLLTARLHAAFPVGRRIVLWVRIPPGVGPASGGSALGALAVRACSEQSHADGGKGGCAHQDAGSALELLHCSSLNGGHRDGAW